MLTRSAAKCSEKATTEDNNLFTPRIQRTLRSSISETKQRSVIKETNEIPISNIEMVNSKRSRTPLSTPRKKVRNKSPETPKEKHVMIEKSCPDLPQTPVFNINIHVPPITVNSPLPGLPPIQPIICLNFDELSKTLAKKETFTSSPENMEKLKDIFMKVTPKCNIIYENGENSFTPVFNTNDFQCNMKYNNLNSDVKSNVNLNLNSNFNNSLRKTMRDSMTSSKQVNTLRSSKSSKKEKLNPLENDKDFRSVAPEMDGKLKSLIKKELRRNLSTSDLDDLKIISKKKPKSSGVNKNISHSGSNFFKKFNLKKAVVVLENIDGKIHNNVDQELSFETFSERICKTSSLNNSKGSLEDDFEEDSPKSGNLKLKKDVSKKSKKPEGNYPKSSTGITFSDILKKDFYVNTDQNCIGSERISKDEILRNIKRVVGNYKSGCGSDSSDSEIVEGTTECLNNSFKQAKVNCNAGENGNVDNRNETDFSLTKKSCKSSEKNKTNCKKSLQFDNSDLQTTNKEKGKIYSLVYESDTDDSIQKEKIYSIIEGCNFSELIKKIQNNEIRKEILSLVENSDNLNSKNSKVCNSSKNCEVSETEKTLGGSKNVDTDNQLEKCQESNKNTGGDSEMSESNVEKNTSFCDSDATYFSGDFTPNTTLCNFDYLSESKEKSGKNKSNNTSNISNKDSVTNSVVFDDDSESMSSASTVLFDDLKCTQSKENENDGETLIKNNDDSSYYVKNVFNVGSNKKNTNDSKIDCKNKNKIASKNPDTSEDYDNDSSEDEIEKNEKDFSKVRSSISCSSKKTESKSVNKLEECSNSSEVENKRKKSKISKKAKNNRKCDEQIEKDKEGKNETEYVRKNISSDSDSSNSSEDEDIGKNSTVLRKANTNSKSEKVVKNISVSEAENVRKNISGDGDSSDTSEDETEGRNSKTLQKGNNNNGKCNKPTEEKNEEIDSENIGKNISSDSDSSEDENEGERNVNIITGNKEKKTEEERGSEVEERLRSDNEDPKKKSVVPKKPNDSKFSEKVVDVSVTETKSMRTNTSSYSDSSEDEDEKIIRNILKQVNNDSKYKKLIEENREKQTKNTRKNNSSSSRGSSEDKDEEKISKGIKKANNNCNKSFKEKIEAKNIRKNIFNDSDSSDSSEDEEEEIMSKVLKKENNKCSNSIEKNKEKPQTENLRKGVSSDSDSSENENEEDSNKATLKSNGDKGFNGKITEQKKIDKNACENSDSSEDDNEEKQSLILKKANYNKKCGEKVIEDVEEESENISSDRSEDESKKKTNYANSLNEKIREQKKKRFKNVSERSDESDSEGENKKESRKSLKRKDGKFNENKKESRSENLIKKFIGASFSREKKNNLKQTNENDSFCAGTENDEGKNKSVNYSESSESEDEGNEKLNRKERNLENVKRNIFKNDFKSENEKKNNISPKRISKSNGCDKNPKEEVECAVNGKYNSDRSESINDRNLKRINISGETEDGGKKSEKVKIKKRKKMEEEKSDNDDCESENGFSGGSATNESKINGEGHPDGDKPKKKVRKMKEIQRTEVQTLETEIKDLSNENNSELVEKHNLDLSEEGKVKRHAKSPKNLGKSPGKRKVQVIEKDPNHQESSPRKKKLGKPKSKVESSCKAKSKKKMYTEDYIPLKAMGSTRFAVSNLSKIQPYQKHSALNFKKEMFFGDSVKRFKSNAEYAAYKHKQKVRNFK